MSKKTVAVISCIVIGIALYLNDADNAKTVKENSNNSAISTQQLRGAPQPSQYPQGSKDYYLSWERWNEAEVIEQQRHVNQAYNNLRDAKKTNSSVIVCQQAYDTAVKTLNAYKEEAEKYRKLAANAK